MLKNLHVKNLALIREADIEFHPGLNILTGETGAGKSLLLGSVNLALGAKTSKEFIRHDSDSAYAELEFSIEKEETAKLIRELGYDADGSVCLSRRISPERSVCRVNGESASAADVKKIASELLDIHGQHEHQSLLDKKRQLEILDRFCGASLYGPAEKVKDLYNRLKETAAALKLYDMPGDERLREISLIEYELREIDEGMPKEGEEEELDAAFLKMKNACDIGTYAGEAYDLLNCDGKARDAVGEALSKIEKISSFDPALDNIAQSLRDAEGILSDAGSDLSSYLDDMDFSEEEMQRVSGRLDVINHLKARYGKTIAEIKKYADGRRERLDFLNDYEESLEKLKKQKEEINAELIPACQVLSGIRKEYSEILSARIEKELEELNFRSPSFKIAFTEKAPSENGSDDICFMISANLGEPIKPLTLVASGGEMSRIMLAVKTILSDDDSVDVLVFDEIDAGISGRTAAKVAEKMSLISKKHQVICITHLAQIAAKADAHYLIEKEALSEETVTNIRLLDEEESVRELARILGGEEITHSALLNAREMKEKVSETEE